MKKFDEARITKSELNLKGMEKPIPIIMVEPKEASETVCIFINGLNGNIGMIPYFDFETFDDKYLLGFDQRAQGDNHNKPTKNYWVYVDDLDLIINHIKASMPHVKKIILLGESWGTALAILYNQKYPNHVSKILGCNMPNEIVNISPLSVWSQTVISLKICFTLLTNIDTKILSPFAEVLSSNKVLKRIVKMQSKVKYSSKVTLASHFSFRKAWKILVTEIAREDSIVYYVQSGEDKMISKSNKLLDKSASNYIFIKTGYHILTLEKNGEDFFKLI